MLHTKKNIKQKINAVADTQGTYMYILVQIGHKISSSSNKLYYFINLRLTSELYHAKVLRNNKF